MKMLKEDYQIITEAFKANDHQIIAHYNHIKESGQFKSLETRVAWDCLRAFVSGSFINDQYDKGLNDTHIKTACVKALKNII